MQSKIKPIRIIERFVIIIFSLEKILYQFLGKRLTFLIIVPRHEFVEVWDFGVLDVCQGMSQPALRVNIIELAGLNQGVAYGRWFAAFLRP